MPKHFGWEIVLLGGRKSSMIALLNIILLDIYTTYTEFQTGKGGLATEERYPMVIAD